MRILTRDHVDVKEGRLLKWRHIEHYKTTTNKYQMGSSYDNLYLRNLFFFSDIWNNSQMVIFIHKSQRIVLCCLWQVMRIFKEIFNNLMTRRIYKALNYKKSKESKNVILGIFVFISIWSTLLKFSLSFTLWFNCQISCKYCADAGNE